MTSRKRAALAGCSVFLLGFAALFRLRRAKRTMKKTAAAISARKIAQSHQTAAVVSTASCKFSLRGEEQVAAHRGRLDRLPASVGPADKDGAVIHAHLLGREIADRVLGQRVAREGKLHCSATER